MKNNKTQILIKSFTDKYPPETKLHQIVMAEIMNRRIFRPSKLWESRSIASALGKSDALISRDMNGRPGGGKTLVRILRYIVRTDKKLNKNKIAA